MNIVAVVAITFCTKMHTAMAIVGCTASGVIADWFVKSLKSAMENKNGQTIKWRGVNKVLSGIVEGEFAECYVVKLENGKAVLVNPKSIIKE